MRRRSLGIAVVAFSVLAVSQLGTAQAQDVSAQIPFSYFEAVEIEDPPPADPANGVDAEAQAKTKAHNKLNDLVAQMLALGLDVEVVINNDFGGHSYHAGAGPFGVNFWRGTHTLDGHLVITGPPWIVIPVAQMMGL